MPSNITFLGDNDVKNSKLSINRSSSRGGSLGCRLSDTGASSEFQYKVFMR